MTHSMGDLLAQVIKIVSNPTSNLMGAMLLLAMVVLVLLILAVAALVTILPGGDEEENGSPELVGAQEEPPPGKPVAHRDDEGGVDEAARRPRRAPSRTSRPLVWIPPLLVAVSLVWSWQLTGSPSLCVSCHASAPAVKSWAKGDHRRATCTACHEDGGIGLVPAAVRRVSNGLASLGGLQTVEHRRPVPAYRCLGCHGAVRTGTLKVGRIKVRHSDFLDAGYDCLRCHEGVGHSPADTPKRAVDMNHCVTCHDGNRAPAACETCHIGDTSSAIRVSRAVYPLVDIPARPGCTGCHETKTCLACHGIVMPHPRGFAEGKGHARLAAFEGKDELCYRCHTSADCRRCHKGEFSAHGSDADWKRRHPGGVPLDGRDACACHTSKNFCGLCHATSSKR